MDQETFKMALLLYNERKTSVTNICKKFGISNRTFYRYLEKHREQKEKMEKNKSSPKVTSCAGRYIW